MRKKLLLGILAVAFIALASSLFILGKKSKVSAGGAKSGFFSEAGLINQAKDLEKKGELALAKGVYQKLISEYPGANEVMQWQKKTEEINIKLLFSPVLTPKSVIYEIKPGDTLAKIARQFRTTADLIKRSNNLADDRINPGRKIKIWNVSFSILVDKSQNILTLKSDEEIMKTYIVSTGKNNSTPTGNFKITSKLINPTWFKAGTVVPSGSANNILGTRWMGFDLAGYGIHGTTEPQSLGKQVTQGCVRMSNADAEELYTIIPAGTEVTIVD